MFGSQCVSRQEQTSFIFEMTLYIETDDRQQRKWFNPGADLLQQNKPLINELELIMTMKVICAYHWCFWAVNYLPDQNTKVCPRQEATEDIANFIM